MAAETGSGRAAILGAVRAALKRGPLPPERARALDADMERHASRTIPARGRPADLAEAFARVAGGAAAEVLRLSDRAEVPGAIADRLAALNLPPEIRIAPDPALRALPWDARPLLRVEEGAGIAGTLVGIAMADAGVAETGTLVLCSGAAASTTLNFVPDVAFVVLPEGRIDGALEDVWARLRDRLGPEFPPRTVNLVTGPSRTGDIEQKMVMGAHGPRRLVVLMVPGS